MTAVGKITMHAAHFCHLGKSFPVINTYKNQYVKKNINTARRSRSDHVKRVLAEPKKENQLLKSKTHHRANVKQIEKNRTLERSLALISMKTPRASAITAAGRCE